MLNLSQRSAEKELLDTNDIPFRDIRQNLIELNTVNSLLGGHAITLAGVLPFLHQKKFIHIAEIGCGGGDNLHVISSFLTKKNIAHTLTGIDMKRECVVYANEKYPAIDFICSDYRCVVFEKKPDVIFNSLFCHHFTNTQLAEVLQWMKNNSADGFFINDLQRNLLAYYAIKWLTKMFSKSYLVKNDAPLSVARSFTKHDWQQIFKESGIQYESIKWKWAFRYLVHYRHNVR